MLEQPVDWAPGTTVHVTRDSNSQRFGEDVCLGGSKWDDSPEAIQDWIDWFDSLVPVFTGEELAQFESELGAARDQQRALLSGWSEKVAHLL